ncbi:hypothetical protein VTN00DRAFT_5998 [Thermoascus crustaceus]|uniref:uncharacterized protein n=1 Tax=Thermoascus crustaceus TaxID=5088 RepID=UPI0037425345
MKMLLPSALPCEVRKHPNRPHFGASRLFAVTPPPFDDSLPSGNGLLGTCRALQSLLNVSPAPSPRRAKPERLQSPLQIRPVRATRSSQNIVRPEQPQRKQPPRGVNKRRRDCFEEESNVETTGTEFLTPKRPRRAPLDLPLGLAPSDFDTPGSASPKQPRRRILQHAEREETPNPDSVIPSIEVPDDNSADSDSDWTAEDDRRLVEVVLEKLQLSKRDWDECARRIGKDHDSVGRRWRALVGEGNVGLRGRRMV